MNGRDRTADFNLAIRSLQPHQQAYMNGSVPNSKTHALIVHKNGFMTIAKQVSHDLSNTFAKLEKLTLLAQKKSLFDDKSDEIQQLTFIIKQDINSLNEQISKLQQLSHNVSSQNGRLKQSHTGSVVLTLQSHLAKMSNKFKSVLEIRTKNMKEQKQRRSEFTISSGISSSILDPTTSGYKSSVLLQDEANSARGDYDQHVSIDMDSMGNKNTHRYQQQLQLIDEQESYIQSRADTMVNIEQTIVELGTIFQQLAHMVKEQEDIVHRIDSNVEESQLNIEAAHTELVKYFQKITSNRWLMIKIFGVLLLFFIIFVVLIA